MFEGIKKRFREPFLLFSWVGAGALALLVINDHLLKPAFGAGSFGTVTGKLSDFAGIVLTLLVMEFFIRTISGVSRMSSLLISSTLTMSLFLALELSQRFVDFYVAVSQNVFDLVGFEAVSASTMDSTDLYALVMIPVVCLSSLSLIRRHIRPSQGSPDAA